MDYVEMLNGMKASRYSLGTWGFSGAAVWGPNEEDESISTIRLAVDLGVNLFDTAAMYGNGLAETILGKAIQGLRDRVYVATKVRIGKLRYDEVIQECEDSLRRLGIEHIDLYQIHWPDPVVPLEETLRAFDKLKADGKIGAMGVCNFGPQCVAACKGRGAVANQLPYNLLWRQVEDVIIPDSIAAGMSIWPYCPLAQGLLTGKFHSVEDVPLNRRQTRYYSSDWKQGRHSDPGFEREIFAFLAELNALSGETGYGMAAMALAFLKTRPGVRSVLVGARNEKQLRDNLATFATVIPDDVMAKVLRLSDALKPKMGVNPDMWVSENGGRLS